MNTPVEVEEVVMEVMEGVVGMAEEVEGEEGMGGLSRHQDTPQSRE